MRARSAIAAILALSGATGPGVAGEADVIAATAVAEGEGRWTVSATIRHADTGWEHYANRFDVVAPDGTVLGQRVLLHPHVDEQPFTRSLPGVAVPDHVSEIVVRAHDSVHGLGGEEVPIALKPQGR